MHALTDLSDQALQDLVTQHGGKPFVARQLSHWIYKQRASTWEACSNLPKALKVALSAEHKLRSSSIAERAPSSDGTEKLLLRLHDGESVECVIIPDGERVTLCISTQVGCPVGCIFCASGLAGVRRNLSSGEIVEQVLWGLDTLSERSNPSYAQFSNLVVMGLGEPMLNLDNLLPALDRIHDPDGIGLGARRITVSTSGYPDRIDRFSEAEHAYSLAISLHAADDRLRKRLVPTATADVAELLAAAKRFFARNRREVTFEIVLLDGVNDRSDDADALIRLLKGFACTVNLIPWNPVDQIETLRRPAAGRVENFASRLRHGGLNVTLRRQRGADKSAACGQLRIQNITGQED